MFYKWAYAPTKFLLLIVQETLACVNVWHVDNSFINIQATLDERGVCWKDHIPIYFWEWLHRVQLWDDQDKNSLQKTYS